MIALLLALHPRRWRARYGDELRVLLEMTPLTVAIVFDVLRNACRQHASEHPAKVDVGVAILLSVLVEAVALSVGITRNILWPPSSVVRTLGLMALITAWGPVAARMAHVVRRRRGDPVLSFGSR